MAFAKIKTVRQKTMPPDRFLNLLTQKGNRQKIRPTLASVCGIFTEEECHIVFKAVGYETDRAQNALVSADTRMVRLLHKTGLANGMHPSGTREGG